MESRVCRMNWERIAMKEIPEAYTKPCPVFGKLQEMKIPGFLPETGGVWPGTSVFVDFIRPGMI